MHGIYTYILNNFNFSRIFLIKANQTALLL